MLNHFRTKLLNLSYDSSAVTEHIPINFRAVSLPPALNDFYNIIFPAPTSRYYKLLLAHIYLRYIESSNLTDDIFISDSRRSYDLNESKDFFKFRRLSNTKIVVGNGTTDNNIKLLVHGKYDPQISLDTFYETIKVTQLNSLAKVSIVSVNSLDETLNIYVGQSSTITFDGPSNTGYSSLINVGTTGLSVRFYSPTDFTDTSNKAWKFIAEAPIVFDFDQIFNKLLSSTVVEKMLALKPIYDTSKYESMWRLHYNKIYRFAALLIAYIARVDNPLNYN